MQHSVYTYLIVGLALTSGRVIAGNAVLGLTSTVLPEAAWLLLPAEFPLPLLFCWMH
jgi:hypothetical protein